MKPWYVQMTIYRLSKCDYLWLRGFSTTAKDKKIPDIFEKPRTHTVALLHTTIVLLLYNKRIDTRKTKYI